MWNHVEISKLYEYCQGESLGEADLHHLARCEFCQELVAFFEDRLREIANSESKAA
jgi:hypothetical protein